MGEGKEESSAAPMQQVLYQHSDLEGKMNLNRKRTGLLIHFKDSSIDRNKNSEYAMNINYMPGALLNVLIYSLIKLHKVLISNYLKDEEIETQIKKIMKDNLPIKWQNWDLNSASLPQKLPLYVLCNTALK